MTIKKAVLIGTLSAIAVGLITFGIKTKSFNNKNTTPVANKRNTLRVDAEEIQEVSYKWLIKRRPTYTDLFNLPTTNINFTIPTTNNTYKKIYRADSSSSNPRYDERSIVYTTTSDYNSYVYSAYHNTTEPDKWYNLGGRVPTFETQPNGNLYTWLNTHATPCYNGDAIIGYGNGINEIRKSNLTVDYTNGGIMVNDGTIQIFLDAGVSTLKINNVTQNNLDGALSITNNDIIIETTGTNTGTVSHVFTISYFNTRPEWINPPYPDPGDQVIEVLDIMPMMFKILTMPFTFISQAFNVTLWEGTPYQFNFANFILSLIAIATLLFIIKLFTSGLSIIGNYSANHESRKLTRSETKLNRAKTKQIKVKTKQMKSNNKDK